MAQDLLDAVLSRDLEQVKHRLRVFSRLIPSVVDKTVMFRAAGMVPSGIASTRIFLFLARHYKSHCSTEEWNNLLRETKGVLNDRRGRRNLTRSSQLVDFIDVFRDLLCWRANKYSQSPLELCFSNSGFTGEKLKSLADSVVEHAINDEFWLWDNESDFSDRTVLNEEIMDAVAIMLTKVNTFEFYWERGITLQAWNKLIRSLFFGTGSSTTLVKKITWKAESRHRFYLQPQLEYSQMVQGLLGPPPSALARGKLACPIEEVDLCMWNHEDQEVRFLGENNCLAPVFSLLRYMACLKTLTISIEFQFLVDWACIAQVVEQSHVLDTIIITIDNGRGDEDFEMPSESPFNLVLQNDSILPIIEAAGQSSSLKTLLLFLGEASLLQDLTTVHQQTCSMLQKSNTTLTKVLIRSNQSVGDQETVEFLCQYNRLGRNKICRQESTTLHQLIDLLTNVSVVVSDHRLPKKFMFEYLKSKVPTIADTQKCNMELSIVYSMLQDGVGLWTPKATVAGNKRKRCE